MNITLRNPHSILAVLETRPKDCLQIVASSGIDDGPWAEVEKLGRKLGITVQIQGRREDQGRKGNRGHENDGRTSTAHAVVKEREPLAVEELFSGEIDPNECALWLAFDCIQDPHNIGALFRAASFFGARGIILTQERSAPLSSTVYDVASGGLEHVPFTLQINLQRALEKAKEAGVWILGTSEHAKESFEKIKRDRPWLLVLGNEEKGMRRLTEQMCDMTCQVPSRGKVTSLNVSVAGGILMSHLHA